MMQHEMESQIHYLEQVAYSSVLRAFKAQSDALSWEKEGLITELRKELRVSDDEHRELLSKVNTDDIIIRIREWRTSGGTRSAMQLNIPQSIHDPISLSPTVSASRKRQKTSMPLSLPPTQSYPGLGAGIQTPKPSPRYPLMGRTPRGGMLSNHGSSVIPIANEASDVGTRDHLVGRKLRTRWPDDNNFYEAVIVDYNPLQGRHALLYNKNTPQESFEWVNLKEIPPEDIQWIGEDPGSHQVSHGGQGHGFGNHGVSRGRGNPKEQSRKGYAPLQNGDTKASDEIEILHTDTLIKEVEKVFDTSHPDLLEIEKAKKMLKEHERALIDVIAKLADASDSDSGGDVRFMHGHGHGHGHGMMDGEVGGRYGSGNQYGRSDGTAAMGRGSITAIDNHAEEYVDII